MIEARLRNVFGETWKCCVVCGFLTRRDKICKAGRASRRSAGHCSQPLLKDRPDFPQIGLSNTPRMDRCLTLQEYPSGRGPSQLLGSDLRGWFGPKTCRKWVSVGALLPGCNSRTETRLSPSLVPRLPHYPEEPQLLDNSFWTIFRLFQSFFFKFETIWGHFWRLNIHP